MSRRDRNHKAVCSLSKQIQHKEKVYPSILWLRPAKGDIHTQHYLQPHFKDLIRSWVWHRINLFLMTSTTHLSAPSFLFMWGAPRPKRAMQRSRVIHDRYCRYPLLGLPRYSTTHLEILFLQTCVEVAWLRHACDNYLRSHVPKQMFTYVPHVEKRCCLAISGLAKLGYTSGGPEMSRF